MNNFSDITNAFKDLPSVVGVLVVDSDGLTLASSFSDKEAHLSVSPMFHNLLNDVFKNLAEVGETANQLCIIQDKHVIIAQPVSDVILIVYSEKNGIDLLQSRYTSAVKFLQQITTPDFSNT